MFSFQPEELDYISINLRLDAFIIKDSFSLRWRSIAGMVENMESIVEEYKDTRQLFVSVQLLQIQNGWQTVEFWHPIDTRYTHSLKAVTDKLKNVFNNNLLLLWCTVCLKLNMYLGRKSYLGTSLKLPWFA